MTTEYNELYLFVSWIRNFVFVYFWFIYLFIVVKNIRVIAGKILIRSVQYLIFVY